MTAPLLLLHGWGFSSRIWQPLIKQLHDEWPAPVFAIDLPGFGTAYHEPFTSLDDTLAYILEQMPAQSVLCGWSLGGMLATQIAARWPERVAGLVTIGSNLHFTDHADWPGMPNADYQQFCQRFALQPEKTWRRFLGLQTRGEAMAERHTLTLEMLSEFSDMDTDTAEKLLQLLGQIDNRDAFSRLSVPGIHCLGEKDAITPASIAEHMRERNPRQSVYVFPSASHALCVTRSDELARHLHRFSERLAVKKPSSPTADLTANTSQAGISRQAVAQSFSQASVHYDNAAHLQRTVGEQLLQNLSPSSCVWAADIGCGTGFITRQLQAFSAQVFAVDIATGMLAMARSQCDANVGFVQADMAQLPIANACIDVLVSNLALQWSDNPARVFADWRRVLQSGGELHFSTFLPGTLRELQAAWRAVDDHVHVNPFVDADTLVSALHSAGFASVSVHTQTHTCFYTDVRQLAQELKMIGAHNLNANRPKGLTGKQRWQTLQAAYESRRTAQGLPASYEVLYVSAC